jgi:hypothetical protein
MELAFQLPRVFSYVYVFPKRTPPKPGIAHRSLRGLSERSGLYVKCRRHGLPNVATVSAFDEAAVGCQL